jgi:hypothetical protein
MIVSKAVESVDLGMGTRPLDHGEGEGAVILRSARSRALYTAKFLEEEPEISEANFDRPIRRLELGPTATDVLVPWKNGPFFNELIRWVVWREGRSVKALATPSETPLSLELPFEPALLVRPALKTKDGPVEVLVLSRDRGELHLVRFAGASWNQSQGELVWSAPLPARPQGITTAFGPGATGSERHVAFTARGEHGIVLFHARYSENGPLGPFASVSVEGVRLLDQAAPAVFVEADGTALMSALALSGEKGQTCSLVEARFTADGRSPGAARVDRLGDLPGNAFGGALLYVEARGALKRREAVIALEDHRLFKMTASKQLTGVTTRGVPTSPILLTPGEHSTYILLTDPARGLHLEALSRGD